MNIKFTFERDDSRLGGWIKTATAPTVAAATAIAVAVGRLLDEAEMTGTATPDGWFVLDGDAVVGVRYAAF